MGRHCLAIAAGLLAVLGLGGAPRATAQVSSWNDTAAKQSIIKFVTEVTTPGSVSFVAPEDRIAVFDNDGTLWAEQPLYFQIAFMLE
jgi:hypothetical protein